MKMWFRRKQDNKALAGMAEQQISTENKLNMAEKAIQKLDELLENRIERRFHEIPVDFERRRVQHG